MTHFTVTSPVQEGRDDDALVDFQAAAAEGSGFAKSMLVEMNPYAAMCNAMLRLESWLDAGLDTGYMVMRCSAQERLHLDGERRRHGAADEDQLAAE